MKKIVYGSLRNKVKYGLLKVPEDNIFYCLDRHYKNNKKYDIKLYNISFNGEEPSDDLSVFDDCDVAVFVSTDEYAYHNPVYQKKTDDNFDKLLKKLHRKGVIVISHEPKDIYELFRDYTFKNVDLRKLRVYHQNEMRSSFMNMRYNFIKDTQQENISKTKEYDFVYWGRFKDDGRIDVLNELKKQNITSYYQGNFETCDKLWNDDFTQVIPEISKGRCTLCFQWPGKERFITTKYVESLALGIIPLVWKNYNLNRTFSFLPWQKCYEVKDIFFKIQQLKDDNFYYNKFEKLSINFTADTTDNEYIYFIRTLENKIDIC